MSALPFSEHAPDSCQEAFERVAAWVDSSLDVYRPELSQARLPRLLSVLHEALRPHPRRTRSKHSLPLIVLQLHVA